MRRPALPQHREGRPTRGPLTDVGVRVSAVIAVPMPALQQGRRRRIVAVVDLR